MSRWLTAVTLLMCAPAAWALAPGQAERGFRDGANHHLGDDSFVARFGRLPDERDSEAVRMHSHLAYVRGWLASRPATAPALAARRAALLGYLDDYIAGGATPVNRARPWRSPVFIDGDGTICAVGYLIERSAGRALAERVAAAHRYDVLEDMRLPELTAWVAGSGFTLDELASIQPGYQGPDVDRWQLWALGEARPKDGPWQLADQGVVTSGAWARGQMQGRWRRVGQDGRLLGEGDFVRGRGAWKSFGAGGRLLAEGAFRASHPHGGWRFFHPSGRLAAEGRFSRGQRDGRWRFLYDDDAHTPIAVGRFTGGALSGRWQHFDARGALLATSWTETPRQWGAGQPGFLLRVVPAADGIEHEVHQGNLGGDGFRIDRVRVGGRSFLLDRDRDGDGVRVRDDAGGVLERGEAGWSAAGCAWGARRRALARKGSLAELHGLIYDAEERACGEQVALEAGAAADLERALAALRAVRAPAPAFVARLAAPQAPDDEGDEGDQGDEGEEPPPAEPDLAKVLADNMSWYIEWPHIDGWFEQVLPSLPDHYPPEREYQSAGLAIHE